MVLLYIPVANELIYFMNLLGYNDINSQFYRSQDIFLFFDVKSPVVRDIEL